MLFIKAENICLYIFHFQLYIPLNYAQTKIKKHMQECSGQRYSKKLTSLKANQMPISDGMENLMAVPSYNV